MADPTPRAERERMLCEYRAEEMTRCHRSVRLTAGLGTLLLVLFAPSDYALPSPLIPAALGARLATATALGVVFALLHLPVSQRHPRLFGLITVIMPGLMILYMMELSGWDESGYFAGLHMLILTAGLIITWSPTWAGILGGLITAIYVAVTMVAGHMSPQFLDSLFSLLAAMILAIITSTIRARLHFSEFERHWSVAEAYRHKSEFFANVSHELRTPIHVMFGYIDMLLDDEPTWSVEERRAMLQRIRSQGMSLHKLVSDLLDSAKVEAGKMVVQWQPVSVPELTGQVVDGFRPLIDDERVQLTHQYANDTPGIVGDERKMKQVLTNLLANALKFTESGFVRVDVVNLAGLGSDDLDGFVMLGGDSPRPLRRRDLPHAGVATLVSDTGIGIHRSDIRHLGQDYSQAGGTDTAKYGGTGLGLSLSRKLVGLMGGHIAVRSSRGVGSTFAVFLPVRVYAPGAAPTRREAA